VRKNISYVQSQEYLSRALKVIPLGSQTFSKSITQYPRDCSPLFIDRGKGAFVFDIDNNRYVDLVNSLAAVTIGYRNRRVDSGVKRQLRKGSIFSLPGKLETIVAEKISALVPTAEMMRFAKNGSDATAAAVRLARAYTGRNRVISSGYHGWQDWFIGTTSRNKGVPNQVSELTHKAQFNDIESFVKIFRQYVGEVAAVIVEPLGALFPSETFLHDLSLLCKRNGAVLIFDETITGFRVLEGGAQQLFGVQPDLSTFGKGIANGFPLSVVAGRREIMAEMEEIFFSGTFGGDLISLAAANEVLDFHLRKEVCSELASLGKSIEFGINALLHQYGLNEILSLTGHPSWLFWNWQLPNHQIDTAKSVFLQNNLAYGILMLNTINVSLAFNSRARKVFFNGLEQTLALISESHKKQDFSLYLKGSVVEPLFKIR
jgi:glutamate-1-semialdehyde 2,1-aminomutase